MSLVYWRLLNRFSGGLLNNLLMLGLHHRCLPENFRKIFQNTGWLILAFNIYKVLIFISPFHLPTSCTPEDVSKVLMKVALILHSFSQVFRISFFYLGFLSRTTVTNLWTAGEWGGHIFNPSLQLPPVSQTLRR